jgi:mannose-1-phosphate guanylyltransferase
MLLSGNYLWNAGIFLYKSSTLIEAMSKHAEDILKDCKKSMTLAKTDGSFVRLDKNTFFSLSIRIY